MEHGTTAAYRKCDRPEDGRRACRACRAAAAANEAKLYRARGYGRTLPGTLIDPGKARTILLALQKEYGLTIDVVSRRTGLGTATLGQIRTGHRKYVRHDTLTKLRTFALHAEPARVPLEPVRRKVQMMAAVGWPARWQARQCGLASDFDWKSRGDYVPVDLARRVDELFKVYATRPGPSDITRGYARQHGWHSVFAYDDDGNLIPEAVTRRRSKRQPAKPWLSPEEKAEAVELLEVYGDTPITMRYLAERYGVCERTILRARDAAVKAGKQPDGDSPVPVGERSVA